jgi:hypothetical protein
MSPEVPFRVGYKTGDDMQFFETPGQTHDGRFGMRVGVDAITFFVIPEDLASDIQLHLVEFTRQDDEKYTDVPLF